MTRLRLAVEPKPMCNLLGSRRWPATHIWEPITPGQVMPSARRRIAAEARQFGSRGQSPGRCKQPCDQSIDVATVEPAAAAIGAFLQCAAPAPSSCVPGERDSYVTPVRDAESERSRSGRVGAGDLGRYLDDLQRVATRCPVTAVVVGMDQERGFRELIRRIGREDVAKQRFGQRFDLTHAGDWSTNCANSQATFAARSKTGSTRCFARRRLFRIPATRRSTPCCAKCDAP